MSEFDWIEKYKIIEYRGQPLDEFDKQFLEDLEDHYDTHYGSIDFDEDGMWIHTGGWSENEEIISKIKSSVFWMRHWSLTKRGGHYFFDYKPGGKK